MSDAATDLRHPMRAIVIHEFGPPDVLRLDEAPTPEPGPGDVIVAVRSVSVNRTLDLVVRAGRYPRPVKLPHVLGADPAGVVAAVGRDVRGVREGDRVATSPMLKPATATEGPVMLGLQVWGGYADYVCVPAANCHPMPAGLGFAEATVAARHGPVAFNLLREKAKLRAGETVLVMGATGGLGAAGMQVAKLMGATVIAAAGTDERAAAAMGLGADHGVNYRSGALDVAVRELTGGRGVDVLFENVGDPDLFGPALASVGRHGRIVTAGAHGGGKVLLDLSQFYLRQLSLFGSTAYSRDDVETSLAAAADGRLRALIGRTLPLADAALAHRLVAERAVTGKIILDPTRAPGEAARPEGSPP